MDTATPIFALPLQHDRNEFADWGWIRDLSGHLVLKVNTPAGTDLDEHRRNRTDPTRPRVDAVLEAFNIVAKLAEHAEKCAKSVAYSVSTERADEYIAIETAATNWLAQVRGGQSA